MTPEQNYPRTLTPADEAGLRARRVVEKKHDLYGLEWQALAKGVFHSLPLFGYTENPS